MHKPTITSHVVFITFVFFKKFIPGKKEPWSYYLHGLDKQPVADPVFGILRIRMVAMLVIFFYSDYTEPGDHEDALRWADPPSREPYRLLG